MMKRKAHSLLAYSAVGSGRWYGQQALLLAMAGFANLVLFGVVRVVGVDMAWVPLLAVGVALPIWLLSR